MALVSVGVDSLAIAGNIAVDVVCVTVLAVANLVVYCLERFAALAFGRASTDTFDFEPHERRHMLEPVHTPLQRPTGRSIGEIDQAQTLARSSFPIKPDALVGKAKHVLTTMFGTLEPDVLADDFRFVAPVVGPLGKDEFLR
jgi:hypothetical protein